MVDHSLHGLVSVRLVNAPASALREIEFLLGPSYGEPTDQPDICVTYTEDLGARDRLCYLGLNEVAYDDDTFYLLKHGSRLATFDFERLGEPCEFICQPGASIFPYLLPLVSLRLLRKGYVMLHSASMVYQGAGILVAGWQKGGKTETLLSFMAAGAQYLSDEWTIISPSEGRMWGIPGKLNIWDWHFRHLPQYWQRISPADRYRLRLLRFYRQAYRMLPGRWKGRGWLGERMEQLSLDGGHEFAASLSDPARLFEDRLWHGPAPIDLVLLAGVGTDLGVSPVDPADIALRMAASLAYERRSLTARYQQFRFAFPDRRNAFLEAATEREHQYLREALRGRPAYQILHPYPVPLNALYEACKPIVHEVATSIHNRVA